MSALQTLSHPSCLFCQSLHPTAHLLLPPLWNQPRSPCSQHIPAPTLSVLTSCFNGRCGACLWPLSTVINLHWHNWIQGWLLVTLPPAEVPLNVHIHYKTPALNGLHRESCSNHPGRSEGAEARCLGGPQGDRGQSNGKTDKMGGALIAC